MAATHSIENSCFHSISIDFNKAQNLVRDQGVGGSNPLSPAIKIHIGQNSLGFPKGFPLFAISAVGEALLRNDGFLLFFIRFGKYCFNDPAHRLNALRPPRLRIHIQRDAAGASRVPMWPIYYLRADAESGTDKHSRVVRTR
jgi:hypothetical protein